MLRSLKSHMKTYIKDPKVSTTIISCSPRAKRWENQTRSLMLWLAELQHKLNSQVLKISSINLRELVRNEWDPEKWNGKQAQTLMKLGTWNP